VSSSQEVEIPKRSALSQARRVGGSMLMIAAIFAASVALFSVVVFIVAVLVGPA
jgi:hypothetical protein